MFIALDAVPQYSRLDNGAGVMIRNSLLLGDEQAWVFGAVSVSITLKDGAIAASNSAPDGFYFTPAPTAELGLSKELQSAQSPQSQLLIESAVSRQLSKNIAEVLARLGY